MIALYRDGDKLIYYGERDSEKRKTVSDNHVRAVVRRV